MNLQKICFVLMIFFILAGKMAAAKTNQPNFIFILVDDLGKEWIPVYGATEIQTPNIDKLAEAGIKFNKAYSMPQCTPSRIALITGQYPYHNGWVNHFDVPRWGHGANYDPNENPSYAKLLRNAGYKTCAAGKWQINDFRLEPEAMVNAGFDEYCMWTGSESNNRPSGKRYWDPYIHTKEGSKTYKGKFGPDIFSDFIIDFMKKNKENPMLIYYPMVLTHSPFVHTPLEPDAKTNYQKHQAMVRYTDFIIGKIIKSLDDLGLRNNTYLILTTDNGTNHAIIGKRDSVYIRGGKRFLSENGVNAPFIVIGPKTPKGVESDALIDFTDIFPTLLDLAGVKNTGKYSIDGKSFARILKGKDLKGTRDWALAMGSLDAQIDENDRVKNYHLFRDRVIMDSRYKVYVDTLKQINRIFDMEKDPWETRNLIADKKMIPVLRKFNSILENIPSSDNNPVYEKLSNSFYDIPVEELNAGSAKAHQAYKNMLPLATKEEFLKMVNKKNEITNDE